MQGERVGELIARVVLMAGGMFRVYHLSSSLVQGSERSGCGSESVGPRCFGCAGDNTVRSSSIIKDGSFRDFGCQQKNLSHSHGEDFSRKR